MRVQWKRNPFVMQNAVSTYTTRFDTPPFLYNPLTGADCMACRLEYCIKTEKGVCRTRSLDKFWNCGQDVQFAVWGCSRGSTSHTKQNWACAGCRSSTRLPTTQQRLVVYSEQVCTTASNLCTATTWERVSELFTTRFDGGEVYKTLVGCRSSQQSPRKPRYCCLWRRWMRSQRWWVSSAATYGRGGLSLLRRLSRDGEWVC